jgi:ribosomal protein L37E
LLSVAEVFEKERAHSRQLREEIEWESATLEEAILEVTCYRCGSDLIAPLGSDKTSGVECRSCGRTEDFESVGKRVLSDHLGWRNHLALKDGGDEVLIMCPFCLEEAYVVDEARCALCGEGSEQTCTMCENPIPVSELSDGNLCSYCQHVIEKND